MAIRKNVRDLTSTEKQNFIRAIKALKASISPTTGRSIYDEYVLWHSNATLREDPNDSSGSPGFRRNAAHAGPAFNPWHRYYLYRFERQLQSKVPGVTIPYWDWAQDTADPFSSPIWSADFLGGNGDPNDGDQVKTGPFALGQWTIIDQTGNKQSGGLKRRFGQIASGLPTQTDVNTAIRETPYDRADWNQLSSPSHRNRLEGFLGPTGSILQLHNQVHAWIGGDMISVTTSPNDPVFFLHHCNVDRLWAIWQANNPSQRYQPTSGGPSGHNLFDLMYPWDGRATRLRTRPAEVLNHRVLGYSYA